MLIGDKDTPILVNRQPHCTLGHCSTVGQCGHVAIGCDPAYTPVALVNHHCHALCRPVRQMQPHMDAGIGQCFLTCDYAALRPRYASRADTARAHSRFSVAQEKKFCFWSYSRPGPAAHHTCSLENANHPDHIMYIQSVSDLECWGAAQVQVGAWALSPTHAHATLESMVRSRAAACKGQALS